ncbi:phosphoenolpyruvate synthase regulatory protein [Vitreoscilla sp. C1]|uniref:posphoenolpyruvate synthetase regulatory kinase/phosphorylase PpsR n=1 Tax=Vitreoscilla sp. (strain C1) TaxID=96942 RepID=UPI000CDCD40B|nr:pyruvate, water dikinase regulatory protein [Vitreoscilla sp. C1]AUZ05646.1 phosphoenolpyruvate synthase regulatory protein [Vitreoscilla sp. C1]
MSHTRYAFIISDRTGITSESMGQALLNQFSHIEFKRSMHPFIDTVEKAEKMVDLINQAAAESTARPLIFSSIVDKDVREVVHQSNGLHLDFFDAFISTLEEELQTAASHIVGNIHGITDEEKYHARMEAVNFSLAHDDGATDKEMRKADVILVGVSRSGKTPTCLYLALQYGLRAANYPLTPDDLGSTDLPRMLKPFKNKLFGLTIDAERLHHIREQRRPNSKYSSIENCRSEVREAESMFRQHGIPFLSTTHKSVEELAANILIETGIKRRS